MGLPLTMVKFIEGQMVSLKARVMAMCTRAKPGRWRSSVSPNLFQEKNVKKGKFGKFFMQQKIGGLCNCV
jgi:hypothetical protein